MPNVYQSKKAFSSAFVLIRQRDVRDLSKESRLWHARLLTIQKGVQDMVLPDDLTRAVEMVALVVRVVGRLWFLLTGPRERKQRVPGGILALLILWALLAGCASQPQAAPTSSSPSKPDPGKQCTTQRSNSSQTLLAITWSGSQFVALGQAGIILTSPDGHTWTEQGAPVQADLFNIAWSGSQFVAVGFYGTILTSPDGGSWTRQEAPNQKILFAIAW